jgi:hypothetical protein
MHSGRWSKFLSNANRANTNSWTTSASAFACTSALCPASPIWCFRGCAKSSTCAAASGICTVARVVGCRRHAGRTGCRSCKEMRGGTRRACGNSDVRAGRCSSCGNAKRAGSIHWSEGLRDFWRALKVRFRDQYTLFHRRMLPRFDQHPPQIDQSLAIQLQRLNRRATDGSQTKNLRAVVGPGEMIGPAMAPRIEQQRVGPGNGIGGLQPIVFVIIASLAGQGQVPRDPLAFSAAGANMFQRKILMRESGGAAAVFAAAVSTPRDDFPQAGFSLSHCAPASRSPFVSSACAAARGEASTTPEAQPRGRRPGSRLHR